MAEAEHKTKIVVEVDTSNAQKNLVDLGKTKVPPVKVPVEVEKPKIEPPKVDPVNIPVNVDSSKVTHAEKNVRKLGEAVDRLPLGIGNVVKGLDWVRAGVSKVMSALGLIGFVIQGITLLYEGFKKLNDWIHRNEISARKLREELADEAYDTAIANAAVACEKLNKQLKIANELERERNAILEKRKATSRDLEDGVIERNKQLEISKLDPTSDDYDTRKKAIERKYEREASRLVVTRSGEDNRAEMGGLERQAKGKDREAASLSRQYQNATATEEKARERSWQASMEARDGSEESVKRAEKAHEQWKKAYEFAQKIKEQMEAAQREAKSLRNRAQELIGGSMAAKNRDVATQLRISNDEKEEAAKRKQEEDKRKQEEADKKDDAAAAQADHEAKLKKAQEDADFKRDYQNAETPNKYWRLRAKEYDAEELFKKLEQQISEELGKEKPDEKKLAELRRKSESAQGEMLGYGAQLEDLERSEAEAARGRAESALERSYAVGQVSQNRLTALGLGSGVSGNDTMATEMRKVVDLLEKQLVATKENKPEKLGDTATFTE